MNVYLIWEEGTSNYKIGKANDVIDRKSSLQTGNSNSLVLIGTYPAVNAKEKESYFHSKYREFHKKGEWFSFPPQIIPWVLSDFAANPLISINDEIIKNRDKYIQILDDLLNSEESINFPVCICTPDTV